MKNPTKGPLADSIELYLAHKRSLGKAVGQGGADAASAGRLLARSRCRGTPSDHAAHIEAFVASRPRRSPRSYNGLIGAIRGLFDWMVVHEVLPESPLRCETRRVTCTSAAIPLQRRPGAPSS